jgi:hypothetical protein
MKLLLGFFPNISNPSPKIRPKPQALSKVKTANVRRQKRKQLKNKFNW